MYSVAPVAFMLLQLLLDKGLSLAVPPPVNVTIQCHNFRTVAYWNYSQPSLHPSFIVELIHYYGGSQPVTSCVNITHRHCDVSKQVLLSIQDSHYLSVKAVVRSDQSEPAPSSEFTYNINMVEEKNCSLDFPPAHLSASHGMLNLEFPHPFDHYREAFQHVKQRKNYKSFIYEVLYGGRVIATLDCQRTKGQCEGRLPIPEAQEKPCVWLRGMMNNILIASAKEVCLQEHNQTALAIQSRKADLSLTFALVGAGAALIIFAVGAALVFRRKTRSSSAMPNFMGSMLTSPQLAGRLLQPESEVTSEILSVAPCSDSEQESPDDHVPAATLMTNEESRFPIGEVTRTSSCLREGQTCDGSGGSEQGNGSEDEEEKQETSACQGVGSSGYDRPHVSLNIEISPGDTVQGYKQTQD